MSYRKVTGSKSPSGPIRSASDSALMKILVTGKGGQLGSELLGLISSALPEVEAVGIGTAEWDFSQPEHGSQILNAVSPDVVLHCGAYTAVDKAESEPDIAQRVNAESTLEIADWCKSQGKKLIYFSTDYVFDGTSTEPYREDHPTAPLGVYGRTKLAGEQAVLAASAENLVLRISWVYATGGKNFLLTMRRLAAGEGPIRVVNDQLGRPSYTRPIAEAVLECVKQGASGLYHLAPQGETTWYGFAKRIFELDTACAGALERLVPIITAEFPTPAKRPAYSVLDGSKMQKDLGIVLPHWEESLAEALKSL